MDILVREGVKRKDLAETCNFPVKIRKMIYYLSKNGSLTFQPNVSIINPAHWAPAGPFVGTLGASWAPPGTLLGSFVGLLGSPSTPFGVPWAPSGPPVSSKCVFGHNKSVRWPLVCAKTQLFTIYY